MKRIKKGLKKWKMKDRDREEEEEERKREVEKLTSAKLKEEIRKQAVQLQNNKERDKMNKQRIQELEEELSDNKERDKMNNQRIQELEEELSGLHGPYDYAMSRRPRGVCVIINNINFKNPSGTTSKREGAEFDHTQLAQLFEELAFNVHSYYDRNWFQMLCIAEEFASKVDHSQFDAFVFIVMSHGGEQDVIYGVNRRIVRIEDLMSWFKAANCPTLQSKPKLFFFQSCRGSSNESLPSSGDVDAPDVLSPDSTLARSACPRESDFMLSFATSPGYVAWRKPQSGSMFIQTLVKAIREYRKRHHLLDILTEVTRRVVESGINEGQGEIQVPAVAHTLRAKVFLK